MACRTEVGECLHCHKAALLPSPRAARLHLALIAVPAFRTSVLTLDTLDNRGGRARRSKYLRQAIPATVCLPESNWPNTFSINGNSGNLLPIQFLGSRITRLLSLRIMPSSAIMVGTYLMATTAERPRVNQMANTIKMDIDDITWKPLCMNELSKDDNCSCGRQPRSEATIAKSSVTVHQGLTRTGAKAAARRMTGKGVG
jgi:hypothetical protein